MSLQYIIDGYNLTNHPLFSKNHKKSEDSRGALLESITKNRLTGSVKNEVIVVFDGFPGSPFPQYKYSSCAIQIVFSKEETADEKIKKMVEYSDNRKNIIVVSDDKEIKLSVKMLGATSLGVEEFFGSKGKAQRKTIDLVKPELNYSQISKINQELKKRWLG